ncbi:MAG: formylglycine-generating enzyme family protein [Planctomycetaceae bacterium]|nr:formylglycine-generating enzyme family protein [Planctomycetaceae bacterium]
MKRILFAFLFLFSFVLTAGAQEQSYPEIVIDESGKITRETAELEPEDFVTARKAGDRMVKTVDGIEYAFRWCPAGAFTMGSPSSETCHNSDETQHSVTLTKGFWMLETEVTQAMWESVMGTTVRQQRDKADPDWSLYGEGAEYPIYYVNWEESRTFCEQLSSKLGVQVSLPTEAQWEYACRAGTRTAYSFGDSLNGREANCDGNYPYGTSAKGPYLSRTTPVKSYAKNAWGLYDMHGNVWEWCLDVYEKDFYVRSSSSDPCNWKDENSGSGRVCRGGSWYDDAEYCRSAYRNYSVPVHRYYFLGFRIVLADPAPGK